jgi:hypothetical protein
MTLFIKNYNKFMAKRRALKGNKGEKLRTRSKREREREKVTIVVRMNTSLLNALMREGKKMKTRRKRKTRHTPRTRKAKGSPIVKLILDKSGTQMMKALARIVKIWQPLPSRKSLLLASHSSQISPSTHASWPKKAKRR